MGARWVYWGCGMGARWSVHYECKSVYKKRLLNIRSLWNKWRVMRVKCESETAKVAPKTQLPAKRLPKGTKMTKLRLARRE
eukprot:7721484-Pyramimonas_sp.AAC.1